MESSFIRAGLAPLTRSAASPTRVWGAAAVAIAVLAYVVAAAHGVVTIDIARDLVWARAIAAGDAWPLIGPPIGSLSVLSAWWYYLAAAAIAATQSLTGYFSLLATVAALKFWLVYRVGRRWMDRPFAIALVAAAALPGVASYQMLGVGHPQMLEAAVWGAALCAHRLLPGNAPMQRRGDVLGALAVGILAGLALHAHPTAAFLAPWWGIWLWRLAPEQRWRCIFASIIGGLIVFLPRVLAVFVTTSANEVGVVHAQAVAGLGGTLSGAWPIVVNLFWQQAQYVADTLLSPWPTLRDMWRWMWLAMLIATALGGVLAVADRRLRPVLLASAGTLAVVTIATTLLRDHTPFYMAYVALPPLTVALATAWCGWRRVRGGMWISAAVACIVLLGHGALAIGAVSTARTGWVSSRLPLHSNLQSTATATHVESLLSAPTRDALARAWWCADASVPVSSLHGDLAMGLDFGLQHEIALRCPGHPPLQVGGRAAPWLGLPLHAWQAMQLRPERVADGWGMARVAATAVIAPPAALPAADGHAYPPRFDAMLAAARTAPWARQFASSDDWVIVSNLLPTSPLFVALATADGVTVEPRLRFANTSIFRRPACAPCTTGDVRPATHWSIQVKGASPDSTSIVTLPAP